VNLCQGLDRLDLDDNSIFDNQVSPEPDVDPNRSIDYRDCQLAYRSKSAPINFISKHSMVDRFQ
jgi:hypothetical protein